MADGNITFSTALDNKELEKELSRLSKKIESIERDISGKQTEKSKWLQSAQELGAKLDSAKAKLYEMQTASKGAFSADQINMQKETVDSLQYQWNAAESQVEKYDRQIQSATIKLNKNKERAEEVSDQIAKAAKNQNKFGVSLDGTNKRFEKLNARASRLASRVFLFSMITSGLRYLRDWMGDVIRTNDEASAAIARLKGALLTMAQPLVSVIIPAFTSFVNILTYMISKIARFVALLFGTTLEEANSSAESLYDEANAIYEVGSAAKKAGKDLAGFDEINKLSGETAVGIGGSTSKIAPDFNIDSMTDGLENILDIVEKIGSVLFGWSFSKKFLRGLSSLIGLKIPKNITVGISLIAAGAGLAAENIASILAGEYGATSLKAAISEAVSGLMIGAGLTAIGVGVWAFPVSIALVAGITDIIVNWENVKGMWGGILESIKSIFTGDSDSFWDSISRAYLSWMGADSWTTKLAQTIVNTLFGEGTWEKASEYLENGGTFETVFDSISEFIVSSVSNSIGGKAIKVWSGIFGGLIEYITGVFTGDFEGAMLGIDKIFSSCGLSFGDTSIEIQNVLGGITEFLTGAFSGDWNSAWDGIEKIVSGFSESLGFDSEKIIRTIKSIGKFAYSILSGDWESAWNSAGEIFSGFSEDVGHDSDGIKTNLGGISKYIDGTFNKDIGEAFDGLDKMFSDGVNAIIGVLEGGINLIISGINWLITQFNRIQFDVPDWIPLVGGKHFGINIPEISEVQIPRLAQGAVIPPNREFMAVLGDQKRGTNVEAPLETIQEAVALVMDDYIASNTAGQEAMVMVLRDILQAVLGIQIGDSVIGEAVARYQQKMAVVKGY